MKLFFAFIAFIALFAVVAANSTLSHDLILGTRIPGDQHLIRKVAFAKSAIMQKKRGDFIYEQKGVPRPAKITYMMVKDQYTNGNGGYATLTNGGPGFDHVELHFTSQWWRGYNFVVDVYGI
ncbi:probable salivary secreted peptide [Rhagoletis pomonella]|uniref:probable salivary secreted peptide n=1 Tax=Rhagoletis pomonella TaxID=28610 RepID=UPI001784E216|nr:probable salivary secreted peptide [Rhagoletis pomonella]